MNVVPDNRDPLPERFHTTTKTDTMKQLKVPHIADIEKSDFKTLCIRMETCAAKAWIDTVCWKGAFPYAPDASFSVAVSDTHIAVMYRVCGMDLRAKALEDNGPVWEDSCCEFFVADPKDGTYYNFEMNCIGTVLASKRKSRDEFTLFTEEQLGRMENRICRQLFLLLGNFFFLAVQNLVQVSQGAAEFGNCLAGFGQENIFCISQNIFLPFLRLFPYINNNSAT